MNRDVQISFRLNEDEARGGREAARRTGQSLHDHARTTYLASLYDEERLWLRTEVIALREEVQRLTAALHTVLAHIEVPGTD